MTRFLLVCLGGAFGSGMRYLVSIASPHGTVLVNLTGSFLIALAMARMDPSDTRLLVVTGIIGGFTTYSAFNYETLQLPTAMGIVNVVATFTGCLIAGLLGIWVARR